MKPVAILGLLLSMFAVACAGPTDDDAESAADTSALSSGDRSYCKNELAKWRLEQARLTTIDGVTDDERALLIDMSWNTGATIALACLALHQSRDIPADLAAHALADEQKSCDRDREAIEKQIADIDSLGADEASEAQKAQWHAAGEQRLVAQKKACEDSLALYRKMSR